jgi:hypothetical protein
MKNLDTQLIYEAYLNEDREARENPDDVPTFQLDRERKVEDIMNQQTAIDDYTYDIVEYIGDDEQSLNALYELIEGLRGQDRELNVHGMSWKNDVLADPSIPTAAKAYAAERLFPKVVQWAQSGGHEQVRQGLDPYEDAIEYLSQLDSVGRLEIINGPSS